MSTLNPELVVQKMPESIETVEQAHYAKLTTACDGIEEMAKASGAKDFIENAAAFRKMAEELQAYVKRGVGQEGDSLEDGTLYSAITASKKIIAATGGSV